MEFNINRLGHLLKKDFLEIVLKTFGIVALIFFVITTINLILSIIGPNTGVHSFDIFNTWLGVFLVSCSVIGAICFEEISKRPKRIEYLNLPSSAIEKTASKFVNIAVIFPILMILLYFIVYGYALMVNGIANDALRIDSEPEADLNILFTVSAIITSFFAYGSIKYTTFSFPKIIIWGLALAAIFGAIMFLYALMIFPELRSEVFGLERPENQTMRTNSNIEDHWVLSFTKKLFYFVPLIFWVLSYFTLKEKEA